MDALTTSTELKKWVAEGNLSAACLALQKFADETNYTELQQIAIQLQRRYNTCQQQIMQGVIAKSDADLEIARISQILLVCSDNLAPSADNQLLNLVNEQPGNTTKDERAAPQASNSKNFPLCSCFWLLVYWPWDGQFGNGLFPEIKIRLHRHLTPLS